MVMKSKINNNSDLTESIPTPPDLLFMILGTLDRIAPESPVNMCRKGILRLDMR
jgi:hypothetical protein